MSENTQQLDIDKYPKESIDKIVKLQSIIRGFLVRNKCIIQQIKAALSVKNIQPLVNQSFKYETFGKDIEDPIQNYLQQSLQNVNLKFAPNKNYYPDVEIVDYDLSIDIKCGSTKAKKGGVFETVVNSNNDFGTLNSWITKKLKQTSKHYIIFIRYTPDQEGKNIVIDEVYFNPIYYFVGMNNDALYYREKDGNLRPKNFSEFDSTQIKDYKHFERCLLNTEKIRSKKICQKKFAYLKKTLSKDEFDEFVKSLINDF